VSQTGRNGHKGANRLPGFSEFVKAEAKRALWKIDVPPTNERVYLVVQAVGEQIAASYLETPLVDIPVPYIIDVAASLVANVEDEVNRAITSGKDHR